MNLDDEEQPIPWLEWGEDVDPPSENTVSHWIFVRGPQSDQEEPPPRANVWRQENTIYVAHLDESGKPVDFDEHPLSVENIDRIAEDHGIKVGKWLVFRRPTAVDATWEKIAEAVIEGRLGRSAKVASANARGTTDDHVICVYTPDYRDEKDIDRVRQELHSLGITETLYYKPDIYTYLNIYRGRTDISPSRYSG